MRLIFLNRFYWPEEPATAQLLTDLAESLSARGHAVTVITRRPAGPGAPRRQVRAGVRIARVRATQWGRHSLVGRAVDFITFLLGAAWRLFRCARQGDLVVAMTDPPMLGVVVWPIAALRGARCLHWVQDVFPEIALVLASNPFTRACGAALRPLRNLAWRRSAGCVAVGHDMARLIVDTGMPARLVTTIPNWSPSGLAILPPEAAGNLRRSWGLEGKFVVAYSGNFGRVHDLEPVLDVAAALSKAPRIAFVFIGAGAQRTALIRSAAERGLRNIHFHPPQPRARLAESLALGDVHLVTLRPGCESLVFPSKLYGIAAVGRPVLFLGPRDSEAARMVMQGGFGLVFASDDTAGIARELQALAAHPERGALMGARALEFSTATGRLDHALGAWDQLLAREPAC